MRKNLLFLLGFALLTAVFLINISLPYGYSVWLIDVAVLLTMFALESSKIITLAVLSTVYVIAGFLLPRPGEVPVFALFNRISGIITIWIVAGFLVSRKRYERLLREEEEWLKTISDAAFEGIYIHDGIRLVDCNNAMYQMLGYKKGELTGKPWVEVITAGSYRLVKEHWDSGTSEPYEVTLIRKDGSQILAELRGKDMIFQGRRLRAGAARDITEARRKEDQLRRSEERLRFALEAGNEGTWDYDLITDKLVLGVRSRRIFGFSKDEEVPYRKLVDRIHPDDRERVDRAVNAAFDPSGDGEYNIEYRLLMPDGSIRWVYARGQGYFRTENGQRRAYRFIGINTDITQRKTIEQQLARERANLNAVFDAVNVGMLLLDSKGTVKRVNSIVTSWVGKDLFNCCGGTPGSVIGCANAGNDGKGCGMTAKCISCPIRKAFGEAFRTGRALHNLEAEASLVTGGKMSTVWFDISVDLVDLAGERHAIMALNNITDRKNTEEKLRGSEERLRLALDAAHAGSWEWDLRTDKNVWSEQIWRLYGLKPHCCEPSYDAWLNSIAGEDRRRVGDTVRKAATEGTELSVEWRVRDEGGERWLLSRGRAVRDENGTVTRYIGIVLDITEQKRAEDILRRDRDSLDRLVTDRSHRLLETQKELDRSRRLSDIGKLAATVAHELRDPLAFIRLAGTNLKRKTQDPYIGERLDNIEQKVQEGDRIIDNLLFYARLKSPHFEKVELGSILQESAETARSRHPQTKVEIRCDIHGINGLKIDGDGLQLKEVFNNLLNNSIEAFAPGTAGLVEVSASKQGGEVAVSVRDNGEGIPRENLERIFEPFFSTKSHGSGLGLSVVYQIVKMHNGSIDIDSAPGRGTTVTITLPIHQK